MLDKSIYIYVIMITEIRNRATPKGVKNYDK